jgi:hypothetical protein
LTITTGLVLQHIPQLDQIIERGSFMIQKRAMQLTGFFAVMTATFTFAAEKSKVKPYPHYWMSVATSSQSIPGMSAEMAGMASMFGGGSGLGPKRELTLQLESPQTPSVAPEAFHDIPPGQNMGKSLPLLTPKTEKAQRSERDYKQPGNKDMPKVRMLYYWGCGEAIGAGQPRIFDSEKSKPEDMAKLFKGRAPTVQTPPSPHSGWTYGEWPNADERTNIPKDSSLIGSHAIRGNYTVGIPFSLDAKRDFMAPVEFTSTKTLPSGATKLEWKSIPTAIGYFATAMGSDGKGGDMIMWSASEVPENGMALMDYLTPHDVSQYIKDKVVMDPSRTSCTVPPIFKNSQGAMVQFIAYGEQLDLAHPPRPKDPKQFWQPEWSVKVRLKSTSMTPLGMESGDDRPSRKSKAKQRKAEPDSDEKLSEDDDSGSKKSKGRGMGDGLRGLFGF